MSYRPAALAEYTVWQPDERTDHALWYNFCRTSRLRWCYGDADEWLNNMSSTYLQRTIIIQDY